jgi:TPR repeat protein
MKRLLTTLVILTGLIGSGGAAWADAVSDFRKGFNAHKAGHHAEAVKWYRKSAEQGDAYGQFTLGWMHQNGKGVTQDYSEAVKWYRKAAEQGNADAQGHLGASYTLGEGVLQDTITAHMWFNIAAANGGKNAVKGRDIVAKKLSSSDIVKAQQMAKRCMASGYKDCD